MDLQERVSQEFEKVERVAAEEAEGYQAGTPAKERPPLAGYLGLLGVYSAGVAVFAFLFRRSGRKLPQRIPAGDIALLGTATFKLSRIVTRDKVTGVVRAPFTHYEGSANASEVTEEIRATGAPKAIGELLMCPFCMSQWIATALGCLYLVAPRAARAAASVLTAVVVADGLQYAKTAVEQRVE